MTRFLKAFGECQEKRTKESVSTVTSTSDGSPSKFCATSPLTANLLIMCYSRAEAVDLRFYLLHKLDLMVAKQSWGSYSDF